MTRSGCSGVKQERPLASLSLSGGKGAVWQRRWGGRSVAKTSPGEFIRQVRAETAKVVWPTRRETVTTAIMVVIMTLVLGIFFFSVDSLFSRIVQALLSLLG